MATQTTLREEKFDALVRRVGSSCEVWRLPCPELVEFVERGETDSPALEDFLRRTLEPWRDGRTDAVVLGCTHFPFAAAVLRRILPPVTELLDGSEGTARQTRRLLRQRGWLRRDAPGEVLLRNSSPDPERLALSRKLLDTAVE